MSDPSNNRFKQRIEDDAMSAQPNAVQRKITKHFVDVGGRRVHYRRSGEGPPVVLLHESPRSSAVLTRLMNYGPPDVAMFAFDTPGCGLSEPLKHPQPEAEDYGDAVAQAMLAIGISKAVVYGTHTGAAIAMGLATRHPELVARLVIDGLATFDAVERADMLSTYMTEFHPVVDGTHMMWLWSRLRDQYMFFPWHRRGTGGRLWLPLPDTAYTHIAALDFLRAGDEYRPPYASAFRYQPAKQLDRLRMPVYIGARTDDMLITHLERLGPLPGNVHVEQLSADRAQWGAVLWAQMQEGTEGLVAAPAPSQAKLPQGMVGSSYVDTVHGAMHVRGSINTSAAPERSLVLLHDSPGGARELDSLITVAGKTRTVIAPDLPNHGDSPAIGGMTSAGAIAEVIHATIAAAGIDSADIRGFGASTLIARALASAYPDKYSYIDEGVQRKSFPVPSYQAPRPDGGHLAAAWYQSRDETILGSWWSRAPEDRHDFGDGLDVKTIHARAIEILMDTPEAEAMRIALSAEAV